VLRVVVAEDSPTVRELLVALFTSDPETEVVGQARTGAEAVELTCSLKPDLVAMDIHMPQMDGLEATKEIMMRAPTPIVLVTSSASRAETSLTFDAMRAGALMVLPKPDNPAAPGFDGRRNELLRMAKAMAGVKVVRRWPERGQGPAPAPGTSRRPAPGVIPRVVAIAASTGGPAALHRILAQLPATYDVPILVVQHIAVGFVAALADWLNAGSGLRVKVAEHGEALSPRTVYLAPDDRHLGVTLDGHAKLDDAAPLGGHRPSGTYLFESAARAHGRAVVALILTGMGRDGVDGLKTVNANGGHVLAQDEATSIVFGMPREAAAAGVADEILPLDDVAPRLTTLAKGGTA
jgi:two-component system chemotaxis response regulator CheB